MSETREQQIAANLASLNEIVAELCAGLAEGRQPETGWAELVRTTLRQHSHSLGFEFQGERPALPETGED